MESKTVSKELRKKIKPILKDAGFATSSTRAFWRHKEDRIEVIEIRSTGNVLFSLPAASFVVSAGVFFLNYPLTDRPVKSDIKEKNGILLPKEYDCSLRFIAEKSIDQEYMGETRKTTWFVTDDESLHDCIEDATKSIENYIFPFFEKFNDIKEVMRFLLEEEENSDLVNRGGIWGMGPLGCEGRDREIAYHALLFKETEIAKKYFIKLIEDHGGDWKDIYIEDYSKLMKNF